MHLPKSFDAECIALMSRVCYDAWWELKSSKRYPSIATDHVALNLLALRVMEAVGRGARDPQALRKIALQPRAMPIDSDRTHKAKAVAEART